MCLSNLTHVPIEQYEGWKVFCQGTEGIFSPIRGSDMPEDTWIMDSQDYDLSTESNNADYKTGFHLFLNKEDAEKYEKRFSHWFRQSVEGVFDEYNITLRKVKFRDVTATGLQKITPSGKEPEFAPCIVARKIFVIKKENECA